MRIGQLFAATRVTRGYLGTVADAIAIVGLIAAGAGLVFGAEPAQAVLAAFLSSLCAVFFVILLRGELRYGRRVRQSMALPTLADAIGAVAQASHEFAERESADAFIACLHTGLDHLADAYGTATGVPCRVTVKIIYKPDEEPGRRDLAVKTVCRSGSASARATDAIDWINENTDFRQILKDESDYFFSNDLRAALASGYRNSHFTDEVIAKKKFPYVATIVWPVRGRSFTAPDQWNLVGFLCVDSVHADTFEAAVDVAPGASFAHALYSGLLRYRTTLQGS